MKSTDFMEPFMDDQHWSNPLREGREAMPSVKTPTAREIAEKFGVPIDDIMKEWRMGISVEMEHTKKYSVAREIALDHLAEMPDYYTQLAKMERGSRA